MMGMAKKKLLDDFQNVLSIAKAAIKGTLKSMKMTRPVKPKKLDLDTEPRVVKRKGAAKDVTRKGQSKAPVSRNKSRKSTHNR